MVLAPCDAFLTNVGRVGNKQTLIYMPICLEPALHQTGAGTVQQTQAFCRDCAWRRRRGFAGDKPTLHGLAPEHRILAARLRQLEAKALEQMKGVLAA